MTQDEILKIAKECGFVFQNKIIPDSYKSSTYHEDISARVSQEKVLAFANAIQSH